jgi:hypothetical protein
MKGNNTQCRKTIKIATLYRLTQELKFPRYPPYLFIIIIIIIMLKNSEVKWVISE